MGIKKIARPLNKAKNIFVKWLKDRNATFIDVFEGEDPESEWDYYRNVSGFIGDDLYTVSFQMWNGSVRIDYSDEENRYSGMSIEDFLQLIT